MNIRINNKYFPYLIITSIWGFFYTFNLSTYPLSGSEPLRIFIAKEITFIDGLFKSYFLGDVYTNKSPFFSFLIKVAHHFSGLDYILSGRLVSSIIVLITSIISYKIFNYYNKNASLNISILILLTSSSLYFGRQSEIDFISSSLIYLSFLIFITSLKNCHPRNAFLLGILTGLEFLIKTPFSISFLVIYYFIFEEKNKKNILFILRVFISFIVFLIIYNLLNNFLYFEISSNYFEEIKMRFLPLLNIKRIIYERLRALIFYLPSSIILLIKVRKFNDNLYKKIMKFILIINLFFFLLPGFQAQYILSTALIANIPAGIKIDNSFPEYGYKFKKIFFITIIFALSSITFLPHLVFKYRFQDQVNQLIFDMNSYSDKYPILLSRESLDIFSTPIVLNNIKNSRIKLLSQEMSPIPKSFFYIKNETDLDIIPETINNYCSSKETIANSISRKGLFHKKEFHSLNLISNCLTKKKSIN